MWLKSLEDIEFWVDKEYNKNDKPLDMEEPMIEINMQDLIGRKGMKLVKVIIQTHKGDVLFVGNMLNGKLRKKLEEGIQPSQLSKWQSRLVIRITDPENNTR